MPSASLDKPHDVVKEKDLVKLYLFFKGKKTFFFLVNQCSNALLKLFRRLERYDLLWLGASCHKFNSILIIFECDHVRMNFDTKKIVFSEPPANLYGK